MEKVRDDLPDFDEWLANYKPPTIKYLAGYNPETGQVNSIGPDYSINEKHTIEVDNDIAEKIISGEIKLSKCFIDTASGQLEITEVKNLHKIDDILHRVIEIKWADIDKPDIFVTADLTNNKLTVELSEEYGGTKKLDDKFQPVTKRKIFWDGETNVNFLITSYNDPHLIFDSLDTKLSNLTESVVFENVKFPKDFSVYTRRLFKNYVLEVL